MVSSLDMDFEVIEAAYHNQLRKLNDLLENGGDPNAEMWFGYEYYTYSAMSEACSKGNHKAMDMLLAHGANPNSEFDYDATVAHAFALSGNAEGMAILLNYEPDINAKGSVWLKEENRSFYKHMTVRETAEYKGHTHIVEMLDRYAQMPKLEDAATIDKATLLARNENGDCLLDHPSSWRNFAAIAESLHSKNEFLSKDELLQPAADGRTWLEKAVACNAMLPVLEHLAAQGEGLSSNDLVTATDTPTPLLEAICDKFALEQLFTLENWRVSGKSEMERVYHSLSDEQKADVPGYHVLRVQLASIGRGAGRSMQQGAAL